MADRLTLSGPQTFYLKVVVPAAILAGLPIVGVVLFISPGMAHPVFIPIFVIIFLINIYEIWRFCFPLKHVRMDERSLYISNYSTEIVVPLSNVAQVTGNRWWSNHPVAIRFHAPTEFGSRIIFLPKARYFPFGPHPVVEQIRQTVARTTGQAPAEPAE